MSLQYVNAHRILGSATTDSTLGRAFRKCSIDRSHFFCCAGCALANTTRTQLGLLCSKGTLVTHSACPARVPRPFSAKLLPVQVSPSTRWCLLFLLLSCRTSPSFLWNFIGFLSLQHPAAPAVRVRWEWSKSSPCEDKYGTLGVWRNNGLGQAAHKGQAVQEHPPHNCLDEVHTHSVNPHLGCFLRKQEDLALNEHRLEQ